MKANGCIEAYNKDINSEFSTKPNLLEFVNRLYDHSKKWIRLLKSDIEDENAKKTYPTADIPDIPDDYSTFVPPKAKKSDTYNKKRVAKHRRAEFSEYVRSRAKR